MEVTQHLQDLYIPLWVTKDSTMKEAKKTSQPSIRKNKKKKRVKKNKLVKGDDTQFGKGDKLCDKYEYGMSDW